MVQKHTSLYKDVQNTGTELVSLEHLSDLQTSNNDAETFKRIQSFPFHLQSMFGDDEIQLRSDEAAFEMTRRTKEEMQGVCDKLFKHKRSNLRSLQRADDKEKSANVLIQAHPFSANKSADWPSFHISQVKEGKHK